MNKWIRWPGLAAFIIIFALMAIIWLVAVDWLAAKAIETAGTKAMGARVDVAKADVTLFPAGVAVTGLEVTDPDHPMSNAVLVKRLHAAFELPPLLRRKIIVNDLRIEGLAFNTARRRSGALPGSQNAGKGKDDRPVPEWLSDICGAKSAAQFTMPKAEDILSREPLQTLQLAKDIRQKIDTAQTTWQDRLDQLPGQKDLEAYQSRVDKLKGGGGLTAMLSSAKEAKILHADIQKDLKSIQEAQKKYKSKLQALKKQSADLSQVPSREAKRLQEKYALSTKGAANLSRVLFGPQICGWWHRAHSWYQRVVPYVARQPAKAGEPESVPPVRGKGMDVRFAETRPLPDFLIRQVHVDAQLEAGKFTGQMADITSQPHVLGKPLTFKFLGRQLKQLQSLNLNGMVNFVQPHAPRHTIKMLVEDLALQDFDLSKTGDWPLSIARALTYLNLNLELEGPKLDAVLDAQLQDVQMQLEDKSTTELSKAMGQAIASVSKFDVSAAVRGTDPEYLTTLESDLDQILQKAVGQLVRKAGNKLASQLRQAISEKVKGPIGEAQSRMDGLDALGPEFTRRLNLGENLLKEIKLPF